MDFTSQYELIRSSRKVLLDYCDTIAAADFITEKSNFGSGSIRNLLVHNANTYEFWIGKQALRKDLVFTTYQSVANIAAARTLFASVDSLVAEFGIRYSGNHLQPIAVAIREKAFDSTPLELFTHAITHEFHHKGQILSLSRHLGYVPIDTDVIR
ncbi:MAG TPA: DinB family protein [Flavobacterium sp.]|nr:DinB family protein [Flavobacterium sp.]